MTVRSNDCRKLPVENYRGCLLGGAVGDALGAPVEFMELSEIRRLYGDEGIREFVEDGGRMGRITDDTQMALFTAEGVLRSLHRAVGRGTWGAYKAITHHSYLRWLHTQGEGVELKNIKDGVYNIESGWLVNLRGLHARRAPGNTCLQALKSGVCGTIEDPINNSKGCGGVMRVAPVGLLFYQDTKKAFRYGSELAAITHGHPSGYLSAGCLAGIVASICRGNGLMAAIQEIIPILKKYAGHQETLKAIRGAMAAYLKMKPTPENVEKLGSGWVGEEALSISIFCALHHQHDYGKGVLLAVNHSGDSDSTGAITGNILGLLLGEQSIPRQWLSRLELAREIGQVGEDLHTEVKGGSFSQNQEWEAKYPGE